MKIARNYKWALVLTISTNSDLRQAPPTRKPSMSFSTAVFIWKKKNRHEPGFIKERRRAQIQIWSLQRDWELPALTEPGYIEGSCGKFTKEIYHLDTRFPAQPDLCYSNLNPILPTTTQTSINNTRWISHLARDVVHQPGAESDVHLLGLQRSGDLAGTTVFWMARKSRVENVSECMSNDHSFSSPIFFTHSRKIRLLAIPRIPR